MRVGIPPLRTLADALLVPLFLFDLDTIHFTNRAASLLTGYMPGKLLSVPFLDLVHPESRASVSSAEHARLTGRPAPSRYRFRMVTGQGAVRWIDFAATRVEFEGRSAVMGTAVDFTDHKTTERAVRESEQRHGVILQSISDEVLIVDGDGVIETINEAAALRAGRRPATGQRLSDLYPQDVSLARLTAVRQVLRARQPRHIMKKLSLSLSLGTVWLSTKVNPLLGQDGTCTTVVLVSRDVTMEKEREEFLRTFSRSILAAQEEERKRVSRKLHDGLAQSLAALRMDLTRLAAPPAGQDHQRETRMREAIGAVSILIEETRRIAQNLTPAILEDIGLTAAIRKLVSEFAAAHGLRTRWRLSDIDGHFTQAEAINIYRILQEVTNNIERHSRAKSVTVSIQWLKAGVQFLVLDDGVGFDTVRALASSALGGDHRGLRGLQERARLLEGSLEITSAPGEGTLVALSVPVRTSKPAAAAAAEGRSA